MSVILTHDGWLRLDNGFDVEFVHGIPAVVSDNGLAGPTDDAELVDKVSKLSGLRTTIMGWHQRDDSKELETALCIDALQFKDVLKRLAISSAALFVDRYHTPIGEDSVDWDREEYDRDFNRALEHCDLHSTDIEKDDYFDMYRNVMHIEATRLIEEGTLPPIEPE